MDGWSNQAGTKSLSPRRVSIAGSTRCLWTMSPWKKASMAESRGGSMEWRRQRAYDLLKLAAPPARWLIGGIGRSVRFTTSGEGPVLELIERKQPYLVAFFHGRQFLLVQYFRGLPIYSWLIFVNNIMHSNSYIIRIKLAPMISTFFPSIFG